MRRRATGLPAGRLDAQLNTLVSAQTQDLLDDLVRRFGFDKSDFVRWAVAVGVSRLTGQPDPGMHPNARVIAAPKNPRR